MPELRIESGQNQDGLNIRVEDTISGVTMVRFRLNPEQLWDMLKGGSVRLEGEIASQLDRIGKQMINDSIIYSRAELNGIPYAEQLECAERLARQTQPDWDTYSARRQGGGSSGVLVVMRRWESDED
jgi:hypothetical protein